VNLLNDRRGTAEGSDTRQVLTKFLDEHMRMESAWSDGNLVELLRSYHGHRRTLDNVFGVGGRLPCPRCPYDESLLGMVRECVEQRNEALDDKGKDGMTPLMWACQIGRMDVLQYLRVRGNGADIHAKDGRGWTILHIACKAGHLDVARFVVEDMGAVAMIAAKDNEGATPLRLACSWDKLDVLGYLMERGDAAALMADQDIKGRTVLHWACMKEPSLEVVEFFVKRGHAAAVMAVEDEDGRTALHWASLGGDWYIVKYLVEDGGAAPLMAAQDNDGRTALHLACDLMRSNRTVKYLVDRADTTAVTAQNNKGETFVYAALKHADQEGLEWGLYFVEKWGSDVMNFKDGEGRTIMHYACEHGVEYIELVRLLVDRVGPTVVVATDKNGAMPIHVACFEGYLEIAQYLVEQGGAELFSTEDSFGRTPLHYACMGGRLSRALPLVKYLVEQGGANDRSKDNRGRLPLHYACIRGRINSKYWFLCKLDLFQYLVALGGSESMTAEDSTGATPLHYASMTSSLEIVKYLAEQEGVNVTAKDNKGRIPLHYACYLGFLAPFGHGYHSRPLLNVALFLVKKGGGASMIAEDDVGATPLHWACKVGHLKIGLDMVKFLVKLGGAAVLAAKDRRGYIPLYWACEDGQRLVEKKDGCPLDMITYLVRKMVELSVSVVASDSDSWLKTCVKRPNLKMTGAQEDNVSNKRQTASDRQGRPTRRSPSTSSRLEKSL
jgi:ankyrin repeat protein